MNIKRFSFLFTSLIGFTLLLSACTSSSPFGPSNRTALAPVQLPGVASSSVQTSALPPLQGQDGVLTQDNGTVDENLGDPALLGQTTDANGSFINIADVPSSQITPAGRDLSGSLTIAKLLGAWSVNTNDQQCRLNLTQTTKAGTNRYRASAPNCEIPVLALIASWSLTGSQIQLYDNSGAMIGAFQKSGINFVGTLAGGIAASMVG